jgi:thymidylate kinase
VHQPLAALSAALQDAHIEWSWAPQPLAGGSARDDVVALARPEHRAAFGSVARSAGFVRVPDARDDLSDLHVVLDRAAGRFLSLRVTDQIAFGRRGELRTTFAPGVLRRRVWTPDGPAPSPDDRFWWTLLRCLLDEDGPSLDQVSQDHRATLRAGALGARDDGEIPGFIDDLLGPTGAASLRTAAAAGEWTELGRTARPLRDGWRASLPVRGRARSRTAAAARVRDRLAVRRRRGVSVAILGPDGAGKSTLAEGIARTFPLPVAQVYMGLWKTGDDARTEGVQLRDAAARPFRAWSRFVRARAHQVRGRLVVFDRYVYDARLPPSPPALTAKRVYFWFLSRACPAPDLALLLDLPGAVAYARKGENSIEENESARQQFLALQGELRLHVIDATRSADEVRREALAAIWDACLARWGVDRGPGEVRPQESGTPPSPGDSRPPGGGRSADGVGRLGSTRRAGHRPLHGSDEYPDSGS